MKKKTKVFCIGLGRSGTTSFGEAMEILGYNHLGLTHKNFRLRQLIGLLGVLDDDALDFILDKFDSFDDYPFPLMFKKISTKYPDAKFILTKRKSPDVWARSVIQEYNRKNKNYGDNIWLEGDLCSPDRNGRLVSRYEKHLLDVRSFFRGRKNYLELCWENGDGWPELCGFLQTSQPNVSFPHTNQATKPDPVNQINAWLKEGRFDKAALYLNDATATELKKSVVDQLKNVVSNTIADDFGKKPTTFKENKPPGKLEKPVTLAICAIFKNEADYLHEWLIFHHSIGVERFYLFDDDSTDDFMRILRPWIKRGIVVLNSTKGNDQVTIYNRCLLATQKSAEWLAFIDLDEFLFSPTGCSLPEVLAGFTDAAAIFVYWALFGSNGHIEKPNMPVMEAYTRCISPETSRHDTFNHGDPTSSEYVSGWARDGKSIVRTNRVVAMSAHRPQQVVNGAVVDENFRPIQSSAVARRSSNEPISYALLRINHYWAKSRQDMEDRVNKGSIYDRTRGPKSLTRLMEREATLNEIEDRTIMPLWLQAKASLIDS